LSLDPDAGMTELVCPRCHASLDQYSGGLRCDSCRLDYPVTDDIADFSGGVYFDQFDAATALPDEHRAALQLEEEGTKRRIASFYLPLIKRHPTEQQRVLDSGCGNGLSIDLLQREGILAWGNDVSQLRRWQWRDRRHRRQLVVAHTEHLPFPSSYFHGIVSSGLLEHVGVHETGGGQYHVRIRPDRDTQRSAVLKELLRVIRADGTIYLDFPNGDFPLDFWHGVAAGGARPHSPFEGFLPTFRSVRALIRQIDPKIHCSLISPAGRLEFRQVSRHALSRSLVPLARWWLEKLGKPYCRFLLHTPLNPFLVVKISRHRDSELT